MKILFIQNIVLCAAFVGCFVPIANAQMIYDRYVNNVVKLEVTYSSENIYPGFGFVMYERDDTLYIATARHVVKPLGEKGTIQKIKTSFYRNGSSTARIVYLDSKLDLAVVSVAKPAGYDWVFRNAVSRVKPGDDVWIIGRDGEWKPSTSNFTGTVEATTKDEIAVLFSYSKVGASGGPLMTDDGVAGMVVGDSERRATAIPIKAIQEKIEQQFSAGGLGIQDLPFARLALQAGIAAVPENIFSDDLTAENMKGFNPVLGADLEVGFARHFSARLGISTAGLKSEQIAIDDVNYQFQNRYTSYSADLFWYPQTSLLKRFNGYLFLGYSYMQINPQLSIDGGAWQDLKDTQSDSFDYSENAYAIRLGFGVIMYITDSVFLAFEIIPEYTSSRYMYINIEEPTTVNTDNDWLLKVVIRVGYTFRKSQSKLKFLR